MPRIVRRGRINRRYAHNVVKHSLSNRQIRQYPRDLEEFETQPSKRSIPHYEDDPHWSSSQDEEQLGSHQGSSNYQSYGESNTERIFSQNPRNTWFSKRNQLAATRGRGKKLKKAEPPLVMGGIPRLDHSFVMEKNSQELKVKETKPSDKGVAAGNRGLILKTHKDKACEPTHNSQDQAETSSERGVVVGNIGQILNTYRAKNGEYSKNFRDKGESSQQETVIDSDSKKYSDTRHNKISENSQDSACDGESSSQKGVVVGNIGQILNVYRAKKNEGLEESSSTESSSSSKKGVVVGNIGQILNLYRGKSETSQSSEEEDSSKKVIEEENIDQIINMYRAKSYKTSSTSKTSGEIDTKVGDQSSAERREFSGAGKNISGEVNSAMEVSENSSASARSPVMTGQEMQQDGRPETPLQDGDTSTARTTDSKGNNPGDSYTPLPEVTLRDPADLERETKKYYEELLGVKETDNKVAEVATKDSSLSASQVADITKKYDSSDVEKAKDEAKQEEIQTAWSILHQYWEFVRENPYDFNGWTYLLNHVESMDNLEAARSAFEGFLPLYPYCFAYWKKLSDMEMKHKEMERCLGILLIGTQCIPLCTDLWMPLLDSYIIYAKKKDLSPEYVRVFYEYGLQRIGQSWHSSCFWEGCISYELHCCNLVGVMALYKRLLATPTKLYNKHWDHFLALVRDHNPRSLLSPEDYEDLRKLTCEELKIKYTPSRYVPSKSLKKTPKPEDKLSTCMKEKLVASYIKTHESNEEQVDKRWKYEERIKRPYFHIKSLDKKQIKNWKDYLDFEIKQGDPQRIIILFERCLVACALYEEFWCQYCAYMERHVQNILDGKFKDYAKDNVLDSFSSERKKKDGDENEDTSENKKAEVNVDSNQVNEASTDKNVAPLSSNDGQVNSENVVDVQNVESKSNSVVRGSDAGTGSDHGTQETHHENNNSSVTDVHLNSDDNDKCGSETDETVNCNNKIPKATNDDDKDSNDSSGELTESVVANKSEPPNIAQIKSELCANLSLEERVLKCPTLTPEWILTGVSWEDVRQIYRRGAWIHCPNKPNLLMQWAEFEEIQGNLDTARELLNTVTAKFPTLLKARMQLIELERRSGCYERVEELYGEASRALTAPRQRSWIAIKYARFLFKVLMEPDRALAILRKALKKDRGYVHLYHHVFDICYQRQPLDCQGVLASVLLALTSKELQVEDKYWFAYKRVQFLREHGDILALKAAIKEHDELKEQAGLNVSKESKSNNSKKSKDVKKEDEKKPEEEDEKKKNESTAAESSAPPEVTNAPVPEPQFTVPNPVPPPNQQFPVPYFGADGAITYSPMEGYGYGHADPSQSLPTAQEVVQGTPPTSAKPSKDDYHSVPPSWELNIQIGSYGYGNSQEHQWHQRSGHQEYDKLVSKGYPEHLKDTEDEKSALPMPIKIDHLRYKAGSHNRSILPDLSQPPPGLIGSSLHAEPASNSRNFRSAPSSQASNRPLLPVPHGGQAANKVLLPNPPGLPPNFTRPPPPSFMSGGPPGLQPPPGFPPMGFQEGPPGEEHRRPPLNESNHLGKRPYPPDYRSELERPYKMHNTGFDDSRQYRPEYDSNYTSSPGPSGPPSHTANFGFYDAAYDLNPHGGRDDSVPPDQFAEERPSYTVETSRLNEPKRYSLRDETFDTSMPREIPRLDAENLSVNVPDWLVNEGGKLCLSETNNGVSVIRYWPNFMTNQGHTVLFRVLRKRLKWYQRRALVDGQWHNLPHLLSWIGPCDYSYSGVTLEKNTDWFAEIVDLLHRLIRYTGNQYNSCYLALHRNGYDNTTWASEDHIALRQNPSIASVSLGATRVFEMRRKNGSGYLRFPLQPGSLLLMEGATQEDWSHQYPKQPNVPGERIHLIFRKFYMIEGVTV